MSETQIPYEGLKFNMVYPMKGANGNVIAWGTTLQAGRSQIRFPMRSLDFSIDLILPAAL
jgi:hypothetical protein